MNISILDLLSFTCNAVSNDSSNCFHFSLAPSDFCNTSFGNLILNCTLKFSMFCLWTPVSFLSVFSVKHFHFDFLVLNEYYVWFTISFLYLASSLIKDFTQLLRSLILFSISLNVSNKSLIILKAWFVS